MAPDRRQQPEHGQADMKDQAKQWLSAGQKWLSSAGKKVAQAVKETQTQINLKLEELEGHGPQSNGSSPFPSVLPQLVRGPRAAALTKLIETLVETSHVISKWRRSRQKPAASGAAKVQVRLQQQPE